MALNINDSSSCSTFGTELSYWSPRDKEDLKESCTPSGWHASLQIENHNSEGGLPGPVTRRLSILQWNKSPSNICRVLASFYSFLILGATDASYGALIPYLESYYSLSYTLVSLVFLSPVVGYVLSALLNNPIHMKFGQRGIAIIGPVCHLMAFIVLALHPPYPVVAVVCVFAGFGNGVLDAAWNAWIAKMESTNELMGFLHGFYGLGATVSPLVATTMINKGHLQWYYFYYVMIAAVVLELLLCTTAFWKSTGHQFTTFTPPSSSNSTQGRLRESLSKRTTWIIALLGLLYLGAEVALGGWLVVYLMSLRSAAPFAAGMSLVGFWLGITIGTVVLGFVTSHIGERRAVLLYLLLAISLELVFWLIPNFISSAVTVAFVGFFLGPVFPTAIVVATQLLPRHLHVVAIGLISTLGSAGAAVFPFAVGAIADKRGVEVLPPFVLGLLGCIVLSWLALPRKGNLGN